MTRSCPLCAPATRCAATCALAHPYAHGENALRSLADARMARAVERALTGLALARYAEQVAGSGGWRA